MTPTAAEVIDPTCQLQDAPEFWRYTPCNGNKVPIKPGTGNVVEDAAGKLTEFVLGHLGQETSLLAAPPGHRLQQPFRCFSKLHPVGR